jgi:hypothetical protein
MKRIWDAGGFRAAAAVQAVMESAFVFFLGLGALEFSRRVDGKPRYLLSGVGAAIGAILSLAYLSFRPVTAALTILAFIAWILFRDRRLQQKSKLVWIIPPLTALLINIHFFALFVPLWAAALLAGDILEKSPRIRRGLLLFLASLAACCLTPMLPGTIHSIVDYSSSDVMVHSAAVAEFRPFYLGLMGNITAAFVVILLIGAIYHLVREPRIPIGETLWLAGSTVLLFRMGRMSPVFAIIAVPVFAAVVPALSDRLLARRPVVAALSLIVALSSWQIVRAFPRSDQSLSAWLNRNGPDAPNYPCFAADFVDRSVTGKTHHLLCDLTWGGFLEWRLAGRFQTLMDGRTQLFTKEFWNAAALGSPAQRRQFLAAIPADAAIVRAAHSPLGDALTGLNWKTVYRDEFAQVLVPPDHKSEIPIPNPASLSKTE